MAALQKAELTQFLAGKGEYFIENREYPDEPTSFANMWKTQIIPFAKDPNNDFSSELNQSLKDLLNYTEDPNLGLYVFISHLVQYYYFVREGRVSSSLIDITGIIPEIQDVLSRRKSLLKGDKRWSGAEWNDLGNSGQGLLGAWIFNAKRIRDVFNGPDLVPKNM